MAPPYRAPFIILVLVLVAKNRAYVRLWTPHFHSKLHCKFHSHFSSHENEPCRLCLKLYNINTIHTKIYYSKYEYTRYLLFIAYFLSIFCITTINTSSSNNNRKKRAATHTAGVFYIFLSLLFYFFWKFFSPNYLHDERVWVFGFSAFCFPFYTIFIFFVFHLSPRSWFIYGVFTQWHQTHWILYTSKQNRYSCMHIFPICNICRGKKSRALKCIKHTRYEGRMGKVDYNHYIVCVACSLLTKPQSQRSIVKIKCDI